MDTEPQGHPVFIIMATDAGGENFCFTVGAGWWPGGYDLGAESYFSTRDKAEVFLSRAQKELNEGHIKARDGYTVLGRATMKAEILEGTIYG